MKKLSIFLACAAMLGFTACETEHEPTMTVPEGKSFVLNEPAFAHQYLELQEGNTFELVASQPDYGVAMACVYSAEVSLTSDFAESEEIKPIDAGLARMTFNDKDLAVAICRLNGIDAAYEGPMPDAQKVYFRAHCQIPGIEESLCTSNTVTMDQVKTYFATQGKREIYLVGSMTGWTEPNEGAAGHYATWALVETEIGSNVYYGSFQFPAGDVMFRFYTALTGWNDASVGMIADDNPTDINDQFADNVFNGTCVNGKGSWSFTMPSADNVNLTVDLKEMKVKFEIGGEKNWDIYPCMYVVGNVEGWTAPMESNKAHFADWRIFDENGDGIYVSKPGQPFSYDLGTDHPSFRFYAALTGWDDDSWGSQAEDNPIEETLTDGVFTGTAVKGKGSFSFPTAPSAGTFTVEFNSKTGAVKIEFAAAE